MVVLPFFFHCYYFVHCYLFVVSNKKQKGWKCMEMTCRFIWIYDLCYYLVNGFQTNLVFDIF